VTDYKTCSVWKVVYGDFDDWRKQTLIYAYKLKEQGFDVTRADIIALMKDHVKTKAKFESGYPKFPVKKISFTFTEKDFAEIERFIIDKFAEIEKYEDKPDNELPVCTDKERFNKGDKYAVMKKGRKAALRLLDSYEDAEAWRDENGGDCIEIRKGEDTKCLNYCSVCEFCSHYKEITSGASNQRIRPIP
jgi:hypothetical protein